MVLDNASNFESAALTWAGTTRGVRCCPSCERGMKVRDARNAQGRADCPYADCAVELYVRLEYEWADGEARLFADRFTLEPISVLRDRFLSSQEAAGLGRWFSQWRQALPASAMGTLVMSVALYASSLVSVPMAALWLPLALAGALCGWVLWSVHLSRAHIVDVAEGHHRRRQWALRLLGAPVSVRFDRAEVDWVQ